MKHLLHFSLIGFVSFLYVSIFPTSASAQTRNSMSNYYVEISLLPTLSSVADTTDQTPATVGVEPLNKSGFDTRNTLAYVFQGKYLVGLNYDLFTLSEKQNPGADGQDNNTSMNMMGPTLGMLMGNWRVTFTYYTSGSRTRDVYNYLADGSTAVDITTTFSDMSGYQLMFGYAFPFKNWFELGAAIAYKNVEFKKQGKVDRFPGTDNYPEQDLGGGKHYKINNWDPMVSLIFRF
jgi:hypothetical protein